MQNCQTVIKCNDPIQRFHYNFIETLGERPMHLKQFLIASFIKRQQKITYKLNTKFNCNAIYILYCRIKEV